MDFMASSRLPAGTVSKKVEISCLTPIDRNPCQPLATGFWCWKQKQREYALLTLSHEDVWWKSLMSADRQGNAESGARVRNKSAAAFQSSIRTYVARLGR